MTLCFVWLDSSEILDREIGDARFKHLFEHDYVTGTIKSHSNKDFSNQSSKMNFSKWFHHEHRHKREQLNPAAVAYLQHEIENIIMEALMCISLINDKYIVDADSLHKPYCDASTSAGQKSDDDVQSNVAEAGSDRDTSLDSDDDDDQVKAMHHIGHSKSFWSSDDGFPSYKFCGVESISIATDTEFDILENEEVANAEGITEESSLIFGDASDELDLDD